jgi:hypothetical protein
MGHFLVERFTKTELPSFLPLQFKGSLKVLNEQSMLTLSD